MSLLRNDLHIVCITVKENDKKMRTEDKRIKVGNAALSWVLVIVLSIGLIALVFPRLHTAVFAPSKDLTQEVSGVMDTSLPKYSEDGEEIEESTPIIKHKITDE